jgi:hypothetical protein
MALMLRKACQPLLNENDFDGLHADVGTDNFLWIFTPCGRPLMPVHGVRFDRTAPTKQEVAYVPELLQNWLSKNKKQIDTFIDALAQKEKHELSKDDPRFKQFEISYTSGWDAKTQRQKEKRVTQVGVHENNLNWQLTLDGKIFSVTWQDEHNPNSEKSLKLSTTLRNAALDFAQKVDDNLKYENELTEILSELNSCESIF